jgi:DNA uptake protein ComE-like DNA-binding protein
MFQSRFIFPAVFAATLGLVACGPEEAAVENNEDITSASSVERTFSVKGYVYVNKGASAYTIQQAVQRQIRSAFGPLRIAKISVDDRELKNNVDPSAFTTADIDVVKKTGSGGGDTGTDLTEGSPNALGVLELVNDPATTVETLDVGAGLADYAAKNVIDGRPYSTIAQLDAVYGIGDWSLQQLLKYAKAQGYVDTGDVEVTVIKQVQRVSYSYRARALVVNSMAGKTSFSFALLMPNYQSFVDDIIHDCVEDYEHDSEFSSSFWYVWSPNEYACKKRIDAEVQAIQSERQGLSQNQIGEKEYGRRYLPVTAQLESVAGPKTTYPEYDRLYGISDPAKKKVVVYQIVGIASHAGDPEGERFANDMGFAEFFKTIKVLADKWSKLRVSADSSVDPLSIPYNGQTYTATFDQIYKWTVNKSSLPSEIPASERDAFRRAIHDHVYLKWIRLEVPVTVRSGHTNKQMTLQFRMLFGTDSGWNVKDYFKEAFKNGDLVLYDGHSYIGSGPLDPSKYTHYDFAQGKYQVFFFNSCVSFNYYSIDFFDLKTNGTQDLDLVTNGVEVWISDGGKSMGQFIVAMLDGTQNTWLSVLKKTQVSTYWGTHDPNRAVDGEQDNVYDPNATPISVNEGWDSQLDVQLQTAVCGSTASGSVELKASAPGATRVEFFAGSAKIGASSSQPFSVTWDTTGVADGQVVLKARAVDDAGQSAEVTCTTTVKNGGGQTEPLFDDMEGGGGNWTATGLWHLTQSGSCASPAYASATSAWYFGQDSGCSFKQSSAAKGSLTSRDISGVTASSKLSFKFWREVESSSWGSYDKTVVEVSGDGGVTWKQLWSRSSKDSSAKAWTSSGDLDLAEFAGKTIRVRFSFDSVDTYANDHVGWMIDDVRVN